MNSDEGKSYSNTSYGRSTLIMKLLISTNYCHTYVRRSII